MGKFAIFSVEIPLTFPWWRNVVVIPSVSFVNFVCLLLTDAQRWTARNGKTSHRRRKVSSDIGDRRAGGNVVQLLFVGHLHKDVTAFKFHK